MVITENIAPPECIKDIKEKILNILNFLTSYKGAENIVNANNLQNITFLNLCDIAIPTNVENAL